MVRGIFWKRSAAGVDEHRANPLQDKRVVVTRAEEQSRALVQALREKGAVPVLVPMVAFAPADEPGLIDEAIRAMERFDWVFLTSQNAVRALQERCEILGLPLPGAARASKIAVVGPATAEAAASAGLRLEYVAVKHQGTSLAEELAEKVKGQSVLLPRSDQANPELVKKLEKLGARVKEIVAYKTLGPDELDLARAEVVLREGADAVLFFSPSAVNHLQEFLGKERFLALSRKALFAAIGPVTAKALRNAKIERVKTAEDTRVAAVLEVLTDYFSASEIKMPKEAGPQ
jgi:uroporphyrinogen-III synthase